MDIVYKGMSVLDYCLQNHKEYLLKEWDYSSNSLTPDKYTYGSSKKVFWICSKGHRWEATINKRTSAGRGCPYCNSKKVQLGFNDLASQRPDIVKEWDFERNIILPTEVTPGANKKVWWLCPKGHHYEASINNRTRPNKPSGCPYCSPSTSLPEISILLSLRKVFKNVEHLKKIDNIEYDIFVKDINLLIEYDGELWHKEHREQDKKKDSLAFNKGFNFLRIYEIKGYADYTGYNFDELNTLYVRANITRNLPLLCQTVLLYIRDNFGITIPIVNMSQIEQEAREYRRIEDLNNSLFVLYPKIAKEWHPTKNGKLLPSSFPIKSNYKAWWLCPLGHEYQMVIAKRTDGGKCPYCQHQKLLKGFNDLETWCKNNNMEYLLQEWNYKENSGLTPSDFMKSSNKVVSWRCKYGHNFNMNIAKRTIDKCQCPICRKLSYLK